MAKRMSTFKQAVQLIEQADTCLVVAHLNPDGDTLGSALALYHGLYLLRKHTVRLLCHDPVPEIYRFLPGSTAVETEQQPITVYDLALVCDMSQLNRAGRHEPLIRAARRIVQIDHHMPQEVFADVRLVDQSAAATAEIAYRLLRALRVPFTPEIATCLLTGIVTDTFSFKFPNTTPRTLRIAAHLQSCGASISEINEQVFETRSFSAVKLLGLALSTLKRTEDGRIAWAIIPRSAFEEAGASEEETEGIVNFVRSIHGVQVAMLLRESPNRKIRVSLRSRGAINVALIAQQFGGGGHENAAGCTLEMSLSEAEHALLHEVQKWMACSTSTNPSA
ncbi:Bifunctional oligoribonuclease and PAP phosphatase NrnA [bacterium HR15]|nr:Bifunctional oligoribonuclease and PAP phosphatase NrnA [bacterium HR15]